MPRYDASTDEDLKNSMQFILEKQFFLAQYRKRKFITDKNVLFDENDPEDVKENIGTAFSCRKMDFNGILVLYDNVINLVTSGILLSHIFVEIDIYKDNLLEYSAQNVRQTIDDLQWYVAYHHFRLSQRDAEPYIANSALCKNLLESPEITTIIMNLTLISVRYGLLITDLCSCPPGIDIKPMIDEKDLALCRTFFHSSDFDPYTNPHVLPEEESLHRKRLMKFREATNAGSQIDRLEASAAKTALKNIVPGSFYSNSTLKRRAGLWIWDQCNSPLTEQKNTKTAAVKTLCASDIVNYKGHDESSVMRELHRVYEVTKKSIAAGEILPIEDGKRKKKK